jgi:hypothetical protein
MRRRFIVSPELTKSKLSGDLDTSKKGQPNFLAIKNLDTGAWATALSYERSASPGGTII